MDAQIFTTLKPDYKPENVTELWVEKNEPFNATHLNVVIGWKPARGKINFSLNFSFNVNLLLVFQIKRVFMKWFVMTPMIFIPKANRIKMTTCIIRSLNFSFTALITPTLFVEKTWTRNMKVEKIGRYLKLQAAWKAGLTLLNVDPRISPNLVPIFPSSMATHSTSTWLGMNQDINLTSTLSEWSKRVPYGKRTKPIVTQSTKWVEDWGWTNFSSLNNWALMKL